MNRSQRRAIRRAANNSGAIVTRAPWYIRGPARLILAVSIVTLLGMSLNMIAHAF